MRDAAYHNAREIEQMAEDDPRFAPGTLLQRVKRTTENALQLGELHSIETRQRIIEQHGVAFLVRSVSNLQHKDTVRIAEAEQAGGDKKPINPFLPYEPNLFVADVSRTHICVLNKYNVIDHHLLIVTRAFENQEAILTPADFEAWWACLAEIDGLGFYNSGTAAGASQPHKHMQIVPLPMADQGPAIPMAPLLNTGAARNKTTSLPDLPFVHAFHRFEPSLAARASAAMVLHHHYLRMLERTALATGGGGGSGPPKPYNLLVTGKWMLLVPRLRENFRSISINALGFAGSLFVRDADELQTLKHHGPMSALRHVALPVER